MEGLQIAYCVYIRSRISARKKSGCMHATYERMHARTHVRTRVLLIRNVKDAAQNCTAWERSIPNNMRNAERSPVSDSNDDLISNLTI